jgi:hypothetical protein
MNLPFGHSDVSKGIILLALGVGAKLLLEKLTARENVQLVTPAAIVMKPNCWLLLEVSKMTVPPENATPDL